MDALTRWKTIATIAIAFSAGNLFSTACQNGGGGKANAEEGSRSRTVFTLGGVFVGDELQYCFNRDNGLLSDDCECPPGFSIVGGRSDNGYQWFEVVCLED